MSARSSRFFCRTSWAPDSCRTRLKHCSELSVNSRAEICRVVSGTSAPGLVGPFFGRAWIVATTAPDRGFLRGSTSGGCLETSAWSAASFRCPPGPRHLRAPSHRPGAGAAHMQRRHVRTCRMHHSFLNGPGRGQARGPGDTNPTSGKMPTAGQWRSVSQRRQTKIPHCGQKSMVSSPQ